MTTIPPDLDDAFFIRFVAACERLDVAPVDLVRVLYSESGVRANAHNPSGNASGILQIMPANLAGVGWTGGHAAFRRLTAADQVLYLERFYLPWAHRIGLGGQRIPRLVTDAHCYTATFLPGRLSALDAAGEGWPGVPLCERDGLLSWAYRDNPGLDADQDGKITAGDLAAHLARVCRGARYEAIVYRIGVAAGQTPSPPPPDVPTERDLAAAARHDPDVAAYQAALAELGFDVGPADGTAGPRTAAAVRLFQLSAGLVCDGIVGPKTRAALEERRRVGKKGEDA